MRPAVDHPQLISTSRHITQGVVDVAEENWDAAEKALSGVSRVVGGDPYELRISKPAGSLLILKKASADGGVAAFEEEPLGWRVRWNSATNRDILWSIEFE